MGRAGAIQGLQQAPHKESGPTALSASVVAGTASSALCRRLA